MTGRLKTRDEVETLARPVLVAAGAPNDTAAVARCIRLAGRDGIASHGLLYLPICAEPLRCGKTDGAAPKWLRSQDKRASGATQAMALPTAQLMPFGPR